MLDFCVVHSSCRSLVTSCRISFVGRARIRIGFKFIFSEHLRIDAVSGACQFLQSRMFLWISSCCPFVVSSGDRSYPNFLFVVAAAWAPASSKKLLYICWYTLPLSWVGPCSQKDLVGFRTLVLSFLHLADGTSLSRKFFTLSDYSSTHSWDFVVRSVDSSLVCHFVIEVHVCIYMVGFSPFVCA